MPDVTILIRAKNEEKLLPRCLHMVFQQKTFLTFDVLLIDSASTDRTVAIARQFAGVTVREIAAHEFNYGTTLNEGVRLAGGRYVVALSAHCVPADTHWLERLVEPLERDPSLGAAFSRQVPWPGCEPVEKAYLRQAFGERDYVLGGVNLDANPLKLLFSNASSCFPRELVLAIPFRALPWAEDRVWAHAILRANYQVAYASRSVVYHSHQRTIRGWYQQGKVDGQLNVLLGTPPLRLRSCTWFGARALRRCLDRWCRICASLGVLRSSIMRVGLGSLARVIAYDLGVLRGQRASRSEGGDRVGVNCTALRSP